MRAAVFIFSLLPTCLALADGAAPPYAVLDQTDPLGIEQGVHIISGKLAFSEIDYLVPGPKPIPVTRSYGISDRSSDGFRFLDSYLIQISVEHDRHAHALPFIPKGHPARYQVDIDEPSGARFSYSSDSFQGCGSANFYFNMNKNRVGLTNTGTGILSARTAINQRSIHKRAYGQYVLLYPNGTKYVYQPWPTLIGRLKTLDKNPYVLELISYKGNTSNIEYVLHDQRLKDLPDKFINMLKSDLAPYGGRPKGGSSHCLSYTRSPEGHTTQNYYSQKQELIRVEHFNRDQTKMYGFIELEFDSPYRELHCYRRKALTVHTSDNRKIKYLTTKLEGTEVLDKVEAPGKPTVSYTYVKPEGQCIFLKKISYPDGRFRSYEYEYGSIKTVSAPAGEGGATAPILTLSDYYKQNDPSIKKFESRAFDVARDLIHPNGGVYRCFMFDAKLIAKARLINEKLISKTSLQWEDTNLMAKWVSDESQKTLTKTKYHYDSRGNLLKESLYGSLTGKSSELELFEVKRTYTSHPFNLTSTSEDPLAHKTTFDYKSKTNLLIQKSHFFQNQLTKCETFDYDDDAICIRKTLNSGDTSYTTEISPRGQQPGLAMPETIRQTITTPQGERLLSTKKITYGTWHKPIKEEFFDREGALAYTLSYTYDDMGNLSSATNALGNTTHYRYDANKNLIEEILPHEDYRVTHTYDLMNRLTATTQTTATESFTTTYTYDTCGNRTSSTDPQGYTTRYEYDQLSRLIKTISPPITDSNGNTLTPTETYTYNALDQITSITYPDGTATTKTYTTRGTPTYIKHPDGTEESFIYRLDGKLETHKNTLGVTTTYTYDAYDNICHTKATDPSGALLYETSDTYNAFHHLSHTDACGITTTYTYNAYGQLEREETENTDGYTTYGYDTLGRQTSVHHYVQNSLQYSEYKTYDLANQVTATWTETPSGNIQSKTTTTYDALGRPTSTTTYGETGPETTHTTYDILGRPTTITDPLGDKTSITYHFQVGPPTKLFRTTTTDSLGRQANEFYDGCGHLRQITKYASSGELILSEKRHYDAMGNLIHHIQDSLYDAPPFTLEQTYGPNNQLLSTTEAPNTPYAKKTTYTYNSLGLLKTKTKPDGVTLTYTYDALGRTTSLTTPNISYHYTYDNAHRLTQVKDARGKTLLERSYNTLGNLTKDSYGVTLHHTYDACERQLSTTLPDQTTITYAYDGPNLHSSSYKDHITTITSRDPSNRITAITLANGETVTKAYDPCGRLISISDPYFSQKNTYDTWGRLTSQSTTDPIGTEQTFFNYDDLNQLLTEENSTPQTYAYDGLQNRTSHNNHTTSHNPLNQIASSTFVTPTYNKCGHLTHKKTYDENLSYTYDDLDRLIKIAGDKFTYEFTYDPLDRRITESYKDSSLSHHYTFLYDGQCEIGAMQHSEITQLRIPLEGIDAEIGGSYLFFLKSKSYYPSYDHRGDLMVLSKDKPLYTYRYTGFGERTTWEIKHSKYFLHSIQQDLNNSLYGSIHKTKTDISPWHFASKRSMPKTGLTNFGRRDYDASLGRWLIPDPIEYSDGLNLYAYCQNSPITNYDAWGLKSGEENGPTAVIDSLGMNAMATGNDATYREISNNIFNERFNSNGPSNDVLSNAGRSMEGYAIGATTYVAATGLSAYTHIRNIGPLLQGAGPEGYYQADYAGLQDTLATTFGNDRFYDVDPLVFRAAHYSGIIAGGAGLAYGGARIIPALTRSIHSGTAALISQVRNYSPSLAAGPAAASMGSRGSNVLINTVNVVKHPAIAEATKNAANIEKGIEFVMQRPGQLKHIFDNVTGHVAYSSPQLQRSFLRRCYEVCSNPANYCHYAGMSDDARKAGTKVFKEAISCSKEIWVHTRNGILQNCGINITKQ